MKFKVYKEPQGVSFVYDKANCSPEIYNKPGDYEWVDKQSYDTLVDALRFYARGIWTQRTLELKDKVVAVTWEPIFSVRNDHGGLAVKTLRDIEEDF